MNKEEHIQVITDREELYDKCENMEQLFDKYYLPLIDKHYSKTYELQQENQKYKEVIDKLRKYIRSNEWAKDYENSNTRTHLLDILKEIDKEVE